MNLFWIGFISGTVSAILVEFCLAIFVACWMSRNSALIEDEIVESNEVFDQERLDEIKANVRTRAGNWEKPIHRKTL